jgi:hypothetical protein
MFIWSFAVYFFIHGYYAFRFPTRYLKSRWAFRGLRPERRNASSVGAIAIVLGAMVAGMGCILLRDILFGE